MAGYIGRSYQELMAGRGKRVSPYFVPRILPNLAPGYIRYPIGWQWSNLLSYWSGYSSHVYFHWLWGLYNLIPIGW